MKTEMAAGNETGKGSNKGKQEGKQERQRGSKQEGPTGRRWARWGNQRNLLDGSLNIFLKNVFNGMRAQLGEPTGVRVIAAPLEAE
jgi:hypothetical protein